MSERGYTKHTALRLHELSFLNKVMRALWFLVWVMVYRPSPVFLHVWRCALLRLFGARIGRGVHPYPSVKIWAPWNLVMDDGSCLASYVDCYCVDKVYIGRGVTVSQYSYLCTASHDYRLDDMPLLTAPIRIEAQAWITADVFIGPGVTIGEGAVVGARSSVFSHVPAWRVVGGSPLRDLGPRTITGRAA